MNYDDVLPDKWDAVASIRSERFNSNVLRHLWDENYTFNICKGCSLFRTYVRGGVIYTGCIFVTKCIKEYPQYIDNKEFK